jgi:hypothetical protein
MAGVHRGAALGAMRFERFHIGSTTQAELAPIGGIRSEQKIATGVGVGAPPSAARACSARNTDVNPRSVMGLGDAGSVIVVKGPQPIPPQLARIPTVTGMGSGMLG